MSTTAAPILPIVHMNGTSREALVQCRADAIDKLHMAGIALALMGPNGRDHYPEPGLMDKAVQQHDRRINALKALIAEIEAEMVAIDRSGR